ncbi:hypothetical protein [Levilactobacillus brevis]|uniref:hypothetical protein n=1 Tax=Levilactobacillus brevis TaxID=1580 RepID=UPI003F4AA2FB
MSVKDNVIALWKEQRPDIKTIAELERRANLSNGIIKQWDSSTPSMKSAKKIADFLNVPIARILDTSHFKYDELNVKPKVKRLARRMDSMADDDLDFVNSLLDHLEGKDDGKN